MNRYRILPSSRTALNRQFAEWIPDRAYVIWFDKWNHGRHEYGEADLRLLPGLHPVAELADGVIFKVNRDDVPRSYP